MQKKIIYLDRDGVINEDFGYVSKIEDFKFINGVFEACKEFLTLGYELIVVTNQSGIGRNYYSEDEFLALTKYMKNEFKKNLNNSWLIGDKMSDIECAKNGNIPNRILISEDVVDGKDFLLAKSLLDSVKYIKK